MEITIVKEDIKEIDCIIDSFLENNKNSTISFPALLFCLQSLITARDKLVKELEEQE